MSEHEQDAKGQLGSKGQSQDRQGSQGQQPQNRQGRTPTTGIDHGAGERSAPGRTEDATSTGATTTAEGSTGTGQPTGPAAGEDPDTAPDGPIPSTDRSKEERGATGD